MSTPSTYISLSTVRIEADFSAGTSCGTGYFYSFPGDETGNIPVIITNKHVAVGATQIRITVQLMPQDSSVNVDGSALGEFSETYHFLDVGHMLVEHPDPNIDLCCFFVAELLKRVDARGLSVKYNALDKSTQVADVDIPFVRPVESIVMVGYPNGLWDAVNNRPLIRRGLTASHAFTHWNGKREFVIDCACFGGSSGSPVFLYEDGLVRIGQDSYAQGSRAKLLGTLWGGPVLNTQGKLEACAIPTTPTVVPIVPVMMNLGFVVHASANDEMGQVVKLRADAYNARRKILEAQAEEVARQKAKEHRPNYGIKA
jgi:hypothetical protein